MQELFRKFLRNRCSPCRLEWSVTGWLKLFSENRRSYVDRQNTPLVFNRDNNRPMVSTGPVSCEANE